MIQQSHHKNTPIIVLMTDFGEDDFFVGSIKGVILKINPRVKIVDLTHRIPSFNIRAADFILSACYRYYPSKTIFVVVVDPGVGSSRKILLVKTKDYYFIAPDNGVLTSVLEVNPPQEIIALTNSKYFLSKITSTFHGRDIISPVAGWLSKGIPLQEFGSKVSDYLKLDIHLPKIMNGKEIECEVVYIDKFGNLITNISQKMIAKDLDLIKSQKISLWIKNKEITTSFRKSYFQGKKDEVFLIYGSLGYLEIVLNQASAAERLNISMGEKFRIRIY
ncbi:MAG: S-adenosyl-l-methionine hydroxide adenosyltransferase family protein [Candidatus Aminicenantia bacterium]